MTNSVLLVFAAAYMVAFVVLTAWLRTIPTELRPYCYPVLGVVGLGVPLYVLDGLIGLIPVAGGELNLFTTIHTIPMGIVVWTIPVFLAEISRKYVALVVVAVVTITGVFQVAALIGGVVALVGLTTVLLSHAVLFWIILGPAWRAIQEDTESRRLLYWKLRNLLLFLFGLNLPVAFMTFMYTEFVGTVLQEYMLFLITVGFTAFVFANIDAFRGVDYPWPEMEALPMVDSVQ